MKPPMETMVAVVGGGPVGLVAALSLHAHGIPVSVFEQGPDGDRAEWRGSTLHPPTIQILDNLGLSGPVLKDGIKLDRLVFRDLEFHGEASFSYSTLHGATKFPFRIQYEQYKLLRLLRREIRVREIPMFYEHRVTNIEEGAEYATVHYQAHNREAHTAADWVLAADGSHSVVRKLLDIPFPGSTYPTQSLVVATNFPFEQYVDELPPVSYWSGPRGRVSLIRTPDIWRVAVTTTVSHDHDDRRLGSVPHHAFSDALSLLLGPAVQPSMLDIRQHQFYRSHQRLAAQFQRGRVLLAGDAAHLSSTTGGMGLNSGIHDAHHFAAAFQERSHEVGLARYAAGRYAAAETLVQPATRDSRASQDLRNIGDREVRIARLRELAEDPVSERAYLFEAAMLGSAGFT